MLIDLAPQPVSFNTIKTPPRRSMKPPIVKSTLLFDNFDKLLELLRWEPFCLQEHPADFPLLFSRTHCSHPWIFDADSAQSACTGYVKETLTAAERYYER